MRLLCLMITSFCTGVILADPLPLIPAAQTAKRTDGHLQLHVGSSVRCDPKLQALGQIMADGLQISTGFRHAVFIHRTPPKASFYLQLDKEMAAETLRIEVTPEKATVSAPDPKTLAHAVQRAIQLLPTTTVGRPGKVLCVVLEETVDRKQKRVLELDLASHLFPPEVLEEVMKKLALFQFDTLILKLNSAMAWRLALPSYPELMGKAASRTKLPEDGPLIGNTYSGAYDLATLRGLSRMAQRYELELIPSFILPGGAEPLITAYPEFGDVEEVTIPENWQVSQMALADNEKSRKFLQTVIQQLGRTFPNGSIELHDGPVTNKALSEYLTTLLSENRLTRYLPGSQHRIDFSTYQHPAELKAGYRAFPGSLTVVDILNSKIPEGTQEIRVTLDSRYLPDQDTLTYALLPRLAAVAERARHAQPSYEDFKTRWHELGQRYAAREVTVARPYDVPVRKAQADTNVTTIITHAADYWPELAFDGREDTRFESEGGVKEGDILTFAFSQPVAGPIRVQSGFLGRGELFSGALEVSNDGEQWQILDNFFDGLAKGDLPTGTRHLRIRVTAAQDEPFILSELHLSHAVLVPNFSEIRQIPMGNGLQLRIRFRCDFTAYPELAPQIDQLRELFFSHYSEMAFELNVLAQQDTLTDFVLTLDLEAKEPIRQPKALAAMEKEELTLAFLTHFARLLAAYPEKTTPGWIRRGMPIYLAHRFSTPLQDVSRQAPLSDATRSAAFLQWLGESDRLGSLRYISAACRAKQYKKELWKVSTGKTLNDLITEYQQ